MNKGYFDFCAALRQRESANNYACKNSFGYLGAYQFGMARLCDLGFATKKDPSSSSLENRAFNFIAPLTEELFLGDQLLQDCIFWLHVQGLKRQSAKAAFDRKFALNGVYKGHQYSTSGCIACCHLTGLGSLINILCNNLDVKDGLGTASSEYLIKFSGYDIP